MQFHNTDVIGIFGQRGCGKSYLCKQIQNAFPRLFIFDMLSEYPDNEDSENNPIYNFDEFSEFLIRSQNLKEFKKLIKFDIENSKKSEIFEQMIRCLYYRGSITVVIEEIHAFCTPHFIGHYLEHLFLTGRHRQISIIYTTQKPSTVNKKILSQSTKVFSGILPVRNDIQEISQIMGDNSNKLSQLKQREFLYWEVNADDVKIVKNSILD